MLSGAITSGIESKIDWGWEGVSPITIIMLHVPVKQSAQQISRQNCKKSISVIITNPDSQVNQWDPILPNKEQDWEWDGWIEGGRGIPAAPYAPCVHVCEAIIMAGDPFKSQQSISEIIKTQTIKIWTNQILSGGITGEIETEMDWGWEGDSRGTICSLCVFMR